MDEFYRAAKLVRLRGEFARTGDPEVARQIADIETPSAPPKPVLDVLQTWGDPGLTDFRGAAVAVVAEKPAPRQKRKAH